MTYEKAVILSNGVVESRFSLSKEAFRCNQSIKGSKSKNKKIMKINNTDYSKNIKSESEDNIKIEDEMIVALKQYKK